MTFQGKSLTKYLEQQHDVAFSTCTAEGKGLKFDFKSFAAHLEEKSGLELKDKDQGFDLVSFTLYLEERARIEFCNLEDSAVTRHWDREYESRWYKNDPFRLNGRFDTYTTRVENPDVLGIISFKSLKKPEQKVEWCSYPYDTDEPGKEPYNIEVVIRKDVIENHLYKFYGTCPPWSSRDRTPIQAEADALYIKKIHQLHFEADEDGIFSLAGQNALDVYDDLKDEFGPAKTYPNKFYDYIGHSLAYTEKPDHHTVAFNGIESYVAFVAYMAKLSPQYVAMAYVAAMKRSGVSSLDDLPLRENDLPEDSGWHKIRQEIVNWITDKSYHNNYDNKQMPLFEFFERGLWRNNDSSINGCGEEKPL